MSCRFDCGPIHRKITAFIAMAVLLMGMGSISALAADTSPDNVGLLESEAGTVHIPFTASISASDVKNMLGVGDISSDIDAIRKLIIDALEKNADAIKAKDPNYFTNKFNESVDALVADAVKQINSSSATLQSQIDSAIDAAIAKAKKSLDAASPKAVLSGTYQYHAGHRNPGTPGWGQLSTSVSGLTSVTGEGSLGLSLTVNAAPAGVGVTVPVSLVGTASVTVEAANPISPNVSSPQSPSTDASAIPVIKVTVGRKVSGSAGLTLSAGSSSTNTINLPRVSGTLVAGKDN